MRPTESSDCRCLLQRSCRTRCCLSLSMPPSTSMTFFVSPVPCEHSLSQRRQSHSARSPAWKRATLGPSVPTRNAKLFSQSSGDVFGAKAHTPLLRALNEEVKVRCDADIIAAEVLEIE